MALALPQDQLAALIATVCFAAGLNVYATVAALGFLARAHAVALPPSLHTIETWPVIAICAVMFVLEFVADKIPAFDLVWNALQTFVRIPVAALVAYGATAHLSPLMQMVSAVLGGAIALAAHGGKTAVRAAVTPSPEPFSNIGLSLGEDVVAVGLTWFATVHPLIAGGIVVALLVGIVLLIRFVIRAMRRMFRAYRSRVPSVV